MGVFSLQRDHICLTCLEVDLMLNIFLNLKVAAISSKLEIRLHTH